jgi:hypothetical protein
VGGCGDNSIEGWVWWKCYVFMYVNGKMRPVETIPGIGWGGINSTMIHYKNFCKCHNVPPANNNKKGKKIYRKI